MASPLKGRKRPVTTVRGLVAAMLARADAAGKILGHEISRVKRAGRPRSKRHTVDTCTAALDALDGIYEVADNAEQLLTQIDASTGKPDSARRRRHHTKRSRAR